ncbi:leucine-rich repeat protein [Faecalibacterium prausnitzii]|uniref:leucine-rich repeat protein n=1 Tax=Faecalibacterium prausnitzii TaxID=853 RepID=UPI001C00D98D|nr:leucine-rich repeat protein [Faecalibacterium prausnitzii]MBT9690694.1 leucine-rich repeat protein [Faecalibacterium prausnitzii]
MKPKRLISLLVAVCMMITMLPLSAVTAFAADTSTVLTAIVDGYKYEYKVNADGATATITDFRGPVDPAKTPAPYDIHIPSELGGYPVTGLGTYSFSGYLDASPYLHNSYQIGRNIRSVDIPQGVTSIGNHAFEECFALEEVTIPQSVTSIGLIAFGGCCKLTTLSLGENVETIGGGAFFRCSSLSNITIPKKVKVIESGYSGTPSFYRTFAYCSGLKYIILPAELTTFEARLDDCPACVIYYNNDEDHAKDLLKNNYYLRNAVQNGHQLLCLCHVTFDAKGGNLTYDKVPVYETEKITETLANNLEETDLDAINHPTRTGYNFIGWYTTPDGKPEDGKFDVKETAITKDITLYARWKFDPNALDCHQLTVTGGTVTVKYDGSDVTSTLNSNTDATTGQKTYYVPEGAEVTVTLDKNLIPKGNAFDGWSTDKFSLPQDQDHKAETITFPMNSDADIAAEYRDAATDHTPDTDTAVCHPLTVTGGIVTVKKGDKDVTDTLTVTTDETTGKKTYSVPDGAEVTVKLDKTLIPEGMVFDIWSTGKFSLPLGQDYKAETITFTMSSDADIAAQYRDATIEDDGPNVLGTAAIIGTAAVGTAVLGYQAYSLGAEFAGKLMALPYFPSNRSALAMMLWEDAGKPMPESELLYPDVGQEEQDMDLQHAARWAMENELIPDLNDEGTAPEEMKFFPANPVSKLDVLNAWQKAQELKNN